jgi:hypothetical protein
MLPAQAWWSPAANAGTAVGRFFTILSAAGLTDLLAALAVILLTGGYTIIRHLTVGPRPPTRYLASQPRTGLRGC